MMATEVTVVQDSRVRIHMCCVTGSELYFSLFQRTDRSVFMCCVMGSKLNFSVFQRTDLSVFMFLSTNCYMDCTIRERILIKLHHNMKRAAAQSAASQRNVSFTL